MIIKGMEMPKNCQFCPMYLTYDFYCVLRSQGCPDRYNYDLSKKPHWCPLIDIPSHGRLIDADKLLTDRMKSKYYHLPNGDIAIPIIDIEHAPTVLEAEVEE